MLSTSLIQSTLLCHCDIIFVSNKYVLMHCKQHIWKSNFHTILPWCTKSIHICVSNSQALKQCTKASYIQVSYFHISLPNILQMVGKCFIFNFLRDFSCQLFNKLVISKLRLCELNSKFFNKLVISTVVIM